MKPETLTPIAVIIPTTCELARWESLQRAIAGVLGQKDVAAQALVVVNGNRYDPGCFEALKQLDGITVLYRAAGSAPLAQAAGREAVSTPFFAFLDDDDEYLDGALRLRLAPLLADASLDFVVTDGYRMRDGRDQPVIGDGTAIRIDPLGALCNQNWMASCGGLFRTSTVSPDYFQDPAPYMEWTYLAFRLTSRLKMHWLDTPTYRINDSPASLSKTDAYFRSELDILYKILALPLPSRVRHAVRKKIGRVCHVFVEKSRLNGNAREAWRFHLRSLIQPSGWKYFLYSRKLVQDWIR